MQSAVSVRVAAVVRRPALAEALPALDPYAAQFILCAVAGAAGALTLKLATKGRLERGPIARAVLVGMVLAAFAGPAIAERYQVSAWSYLALAAFVLGVSAQAVVPLFPILTVSLAKRAAAGWAAAVKLPDALPLPGDPPAVARPDPKPPEPTP